MGQVRYSTFIFIVRISTHGDVTLILGKPVGHMNDHHVKESEARNEGINM